MTKNNKGRNGGDRPTPMTSDSQEFTQKPNVDLQSWVSLGKPSRIRQQKRGWQWGRR